MSGFDPNDNFERCVGRSRGSNEPPRDEEEDGPSALEQNRQICAEFDVIYLADIYRVPDNRKLVLTLRP